MKSLLIAAAVSMVFAVPAFAVDAAPQTKAPGPNFEQRKADILKRIDERIARNQEEKTCIQAATKYEEIKACRDKVKAEMKEMHQKRQK